MGEQFQGRVEDHRLVTGGGRYTGDLSLPGQAHAAFFRAPVAHAEILKVDVAAARAMPGVLAIFTAEDFAALGYVRQPQQQLKDRWDKPIFVPEHPPLTTGRVRVAGDALAMVVAETAAQAHDAAEAILFEYRELPSIVATAYDPAPPVAIWPHAPGNLAYDFAFGDEAAIASAFAKAAHVTRVTLRNQRLVPNPMEPRAALARYDAAEDRYEIQVGSQGAPMLGLELAHVMNLPPDRIRVITRDVGGGFGMRTSYYPEHVALLAAARLTGRPVKWVGSRSECFLTDMHGRDTVLEGALALDADGNFLGLKIATTINSGAYPSTNGPATATGNVKRCGTSVYRIPAFRLEAKCVYTNTSWTGPYRGAGRPEAILLIERLVELAAKETGRDPVALRRRNLVPPGAMPYQAANGEKYDTGDFPRILDRALAMADYDGFPARREAAKQRGMLRGIGLCTYVDVSVVAGMGTMQAEVDGDGIVHLRTALQSNGQGHATVYPRAFADAAGLPATQVVLEEADSSLTKDRIGSFGSRSMAVAACTAQAAAEALAARAAELGAQLLQLPEEEVRYEGGRVIHAGTDRSVTLADIVRETGPLAVTGSASMPANYPNGCQIVEIEIDPRTGIARTISAISVDDIGRVFDHVLAEGQIQGGIAQGLGQVFIEGTIYDPSSGQLLTGSFMDYALPRADDLPAYRTECIEIPSATNPSGIKGAGEAGTTGALAAAYNALMDALGHAGYDSGLRGEFEMPATPARIWQALNR